MAMFFSDKKTTRLDNLDGLFNDLCYECKVAAPSARLSYSLRSRLEKQSILDRKSIVNRINARDQCSPLFMACKRGNVEIVEYLVLTCHADVELKGLFEVQDDSSNHHASPLWCAAVAGRLAVVKSLVRLGADVNSMSDSGSTPVRSACYMTHLEIVMYLVANGADIQKPNYNGGTCLINAVQSVPLCEFLITSGVDVNAQDIQNKTALHYAIQEHRFDTMRLLLENGADPFLKSCHGDDALGVACLKHAIDIFDYLVTSIPYPPDRIADAYELLGSTYLEENSELGITLQCWNKALDIRYGDPGKTYPKRVLERTAVYQFAVEFQSREELVGITHDPDALRIQSLLITERILGPYHKDTIFRLMYRGAAYADALQHQQCVDLWLYTFQLRLKKDTLLYSDTCFTLQALVRLYLAWNERHLAGHLQEALRFEDVFATLSLVSTQLGVIKQLLSVRPVQKRQQDSFDWVIQGIVYLIQLLLSLLSSMPENKRAVNEYETRRLIWSIVSCADPRLSTGDSILHVAVCNQMRLFSVITELLEDPVGPYSPTVGLISILLECGASPAALNHARSLPLHLASDPLNFDPQIVKLLLDYGSHPDQVNSAGERPTGVLLRNLHCPRELIPFPSLSCLAARKIVECRLVYKGVIPVHLEPFVELH